jgi:hypothetical protein
LPNQRPSEAVRGQNGAVFAIFGVFQRFIRLAESLCQTVELLCQLAKLLCQTVELRCQTVERLAIWQNRPTSFPPGLMGVRRSD